MEKRIETTYTPEGLRRAVQNALGQHLSDADVLRYHDDALPDPVRRERIALHLTVCRACRQRVDAADAVHPPMEELVAYHDHVIQNPTTLQRVQAHLQQCLNCAEWVDELQQVQEEAVNFDPDVVWQQIGSMVQPHQVSPPSAVAHAAVQRLTTWKERLGAVVTALLHPPLAPAAVHATTTYPRVHMAPGGELTCVINKTEDGGLTLTCETQHVEWAGGLLEFACCTADTGEMLLSGFSVLPEAPSSGSESAVCLSPEATVQLDTAFQMVVYPIGWEELTDDDVEHLRWSATIAADEGSRAAWYAFARRLRAVAPAGSLRYAWAEEVVLVLGEDQKSPPVAAISRELQQERPGAPAGNGSPEDIAALPARREALSGLQERRLPSARSQPYHGLGANDAQLHDGVDLPAFAQLSFLSGRARSMEQPEALAAASSTCSDLIIERELIKLEERVIAGTERRGSRLVVYLVGSHEEGARTRVALCKQGEDHIYASASTDEGGWVSFDLEGLGGETPGPHGAELPYFLRLAALPRTPGGAGPVPGPDQIERRKTARQTVHRDRFASIRLFLVVLREGDALDRDDAYTQLAELLATSRTQGKERLGPRLVSAVKACLTTRAEEDPHLKLKRDKVLEVLREVELQ
jgi:hypothetical protein